MVLSRDSGDVGGLNIYVEQVVRVVVCVCSWGRMFELLVLRGQMESRVLDKVVDLRVQELRRRLR